MNGMQTCKLSGTIFARLHRGNGGSVCFVPVFVTLANTFNCFNTFIATSFNFC